MKKGLIIVSLFIVLIIVAFLFIKSSKTKEFDLGPVIWKQIKNDETLIESKNRQLLVGPGNIELWANYPYIFGYITSSESMETQVFVIDVRDLTTTFGEYLPKYIDIDSPYPNASPYHTFYDLTGKDRNRVEDIKRQLKEK